jgi:YfiH family protein
MLNNIIVPDWPAPGDVKAIQTTRLGGTSIPPYDTFNLGNHVGDNPIMVQNNRNLLTLSLPAQPLWLEQVHGTRVINANYELSPIGDRDCHNVQTSLQGDACIARLPATVCAVMTADCLPVLLCDTRGSVVGAVHAGWKGLAAGVIENTVRAMGVSPQHLMAWLGPAISQEFFEVGEEVRNIFIKNDPQAASAFVAGKPGKWFADIFALARLRLKSLGIIQIYGGSYCTYREQNNFFSYRRESVTGRMGTLIWLES